jgi:hypothetical protein
MQHFAGGGVVTVEKHSRGHRGGHDFGVAHSALGVFIMMQPFQNIITNAENGYNLRIHGFPPA